MGEDSAQQDLLEPDYGDFDPFSLQPADKMSTISSEDLVPERHAPPNSPGDLSDAELLLALRAEEKRILDRGATQAQAQAGALLQTDPLVAKDPWGR